MKKVCFFAVDGVEGIYRLRESRIRATFVYVAPPSTDIYLRRLRLTGVHQLIAMETRLREVVAMENLYMDEEEWFRLKVVNRRIQDAYLKIKGVVVKARSSSIALPVTMETRKLHQHHHPGGYFDISSNKQ